MADTWGSIARAMEDTRDSRRGGGVQGDRAHEEMYPGHRQAARDANAHGIMGLISGRHRDFIEDNKAQMRELGINPSHTDREGNLTGRYSSGDWAALQDALAGGTVEVDISSILNQDNSNIGPLSDYGYSEEDAGQPRELGNIRQWGTQSPNMPGSMALDPTWAGGLRGAGLGAEMTPGRDLNRLSRESIFAPGTVPGNITGTRAYLPGRMSVGEARRARAIRNMSLRDRQEAGISEGEYSEWDRISRQFDERMARMKDKLRDWDIEDRTKRPGIMGGGPSTHIQPNWAALEEDMARRAMRDEFIGRDER